MLILLATILRQQGSDYRGMRNLACLCLLLAVLVACSNDAYDSGDTSLSYLHAEMAMVHVEGRSVKSVITDAGDRLMLADDASVSSYLEKNDTTYRMMLYYNKVSDESPVRLVSMQTVPLLNPIDRDSIETVMTDPVTLVSAWQSANGSYLNLLLGLKTGNADDASLKQRLGLVCDSVIISNEGTARRYYTLYHNQNSIPEYYTQNVYVSVPADSFMQGDSIYVNVNSYDGMLTRVFCIDKRV